LRRKEGRRRRKRERKEKGWRQSVVRRMNE
jgi:hypothetical protein